jgi:hypothetical protein
MRRGLKKNRATAEQHNEAMAALAADQAEAERLYEETLERLQAEPQFAIVSPFTGEVVMLAAQSMIWPLDTSALTEEIGGGVAESNAPVVPGEVQESRPDAPADTPKIILPGTADALGIETP